MMGLFSKLFGGSAPAKAPAAPSKQDLLAQRQALVGKVMTPEREERLAQAFQAQAAKQQLQQRLKSDGGQRDMAETLQRLMKNR
jgi:hypothetical protein